MKKFIVLTSGLFCFPFLTHAETCIDTPHSAVDRFGTCEEFASSCDVPGDWKVVPSCDLIEPERDRPTLEEKQNQRTRRIAYRTSNPSLSSDEAKERIRKYRAARLAKRRSAQRPGSAAIYEPKTSDSDKSGYTERRSSTDKNFTSKYRKYTRKGNQTKEELSELAKKHQTHAQNARARLGSVLRKSAIRTGSLSNAPKWSYETRKRSTRKSYDYENRVWKSMETLRNEARPEKKEHVYNGPRLRKVFKGARLQGDLSGDRDYLEAEAKERAELRQQLEDEGTETSE